MRPSGWQTTMTEIITNIPRPTTLLVQIGYWTMLSVADPTKTHLNGQRPILEILLILPCQTQGLDFGALNLCSHEKTLVW